MSDQRATAWGVVLLAFCLAVCWWWDLDRRVRAPLPPLAERPCIVHALGDAVRGEVTRVEYRCEEVDGGGR